MIGKKIPNPRKSGALSARIQRLVDYIDRPENAPPNARAVAHAAKAAWVEGLADYTGRAAAEPAREKCIYGGARGFWTTTRAGQKAEMLALAQVSAHSKDPINHYVLSWRQGEQPTPEQIEEAVDLLLDTMGLTGHQALYGLHADTDNMHLHVMVNRVHPVTRKVIEINQSFDLEALHRAVARIEHVQGWRREARGRYRVQADGTLRRDRHPPLDPSSAGAQRVRNRWPHRYGGGARSAARIAAEAGAPSIRAAASWSDLHARLAARGLRYERKGSGALLWVGAVAVKASNASRDCSLPALERRLGPYRPAPEGSTVAARADHRADRRAETRAVRDRHNEERATLGAAHREQRDALWRSVPPGGWRGRGGEMNAQRSLLAARQAGERAALLERQRRERALARARRGADFPNDESRVAEQTGQPDRRRARLIALIVLEEETVALRPRDIRAFIAVVYGRRVDYRWADDPDGPAGFVDRGHEIAVYAERDQDAVRAALQLAARKWGRFRVEGDAEYRALCARVAAECGFPLGHPEPQAALRRAEASRRPAPAP
ncbi:MAG: relaxase/mobilization nuclease domain-containing protein [Candidatus Competibacteraceae bacterium]